MIIEKLTNLEPLRKVPKKIAAKLGQLAHGGLHKSCDVIGLGDGVSNILHVTPPANDIMDVDKLAQLSAEPSNVTPLRPDTD